MSPALSFRLRRVFRFTVDSDLATLNHAFGLTARTRNTRKL